MDPIKLIINRVMKLFQSTMYNFYFYLNVKNNHFTEMTYTIVSVIKIIIII